MEVLGEFIVRIQGELDESVTARDIAPTLRELYLRAKEEMEFLESSQCGGKRCFSFRQLTTLKIKVKGWERRLFATVEGYDIAEMCREMRKAVECDGNTKEKG